MKKAIDRIKAILIWSQKYTKTDMLYLAKGGIWLTLGDVVASSLSFVMAIAFAYYISKDVFGTYKYILSITGLLSIFALSGLDTALKRSVAQGNEGSLVPTTITAMRWATLGSICSIGVSLYYFFNQDNILGWAFMLVAIFLPFKDNFSFCLTFIDAKKLFKTRVIYSLIINITSSALLILTVIISKNLFVIIGAYFIPRILVTLLFFIKTVRSIPSNAKSDPGITNYGKHLSVLRILGLVAEQLDTILLWNLLGASSVAIYSFALSPTNQIRSFLNVISTLAFPKLAQNSLEELRRTLPGKLMTMFIIVAIITISYIIAAPFLFRIFFPKYIDSVIYSQVFSLSLLFMPRNILLDTMTAHGEKKKLYMLSLAGSGVRIVLMLIFVRIFGIWGAIGSYLLAGISSFTLSTYLFKRP